MLFTEKVDYVLNFMQIAYSNDCKRQSKSQIEESDVIFEEKNVLTADSTESYLRYRIVTAQHIFKIPEPYLLNKFVGEFLKSDGVKSTSLSIVFLEC